MFNVRLRRDQPGDLQGGQIRSQEFTFYPKEILKEKNTFFADIKTAGSVTLLVQTVLIPLIFSASPSSILALPPKSKKVIIKGGTAVRSAPPINFFLQVFKPIVTNGFNFDFNISITNHGYYPKGGGEIVLRVDPLVVKAFTPISLIERGTVIQIKGIVTIAKVPNQIAQQIISAASKVIVNNSDLPELNNIKPDIEINHAKISSGEGFDIVLWAITNTGCIISGNAVIDKKLTAEDLGKNAAEELIKNLRHGGCVDEYLQDQLIIFMALAEGKSKILTGPISLHTSTVMHYSEIMVGVKFKITRVTSNNDEAGEEEGSEKNIIECEGIGFKVTEL
nr:2110_t:CDS:10 [Entrophospora candida]